jgi:hypothetical protein
MKTNELGPLLELARKDNMVGKAARNEVQRIVNNLAADLIRCRELLAGMPACAFKDDDWHDASDCIYCQAKTYLNETE